MASRFTLITLLLIVGSKFSFGQKETESLYPQFGVLATGGITIPFTDLNNSSVGYTASVAGSIRFLPFLQALGELQTGKLTGGAQPGTSDSEMGFNNNFFTSSAILRLLPVQFKSDIDKGSPLYYIQGLFIGAGFGLMNSRVQTNTFVANEFEYMGSYTTDWRTISLVEAGISVPMFQIKNLGMLHFNVGYRANFSSGDKIDGYMPPEELNRSKDAFNTITGGFSLEFR